MGDKSSSGPQQWRGPTPEVSTPAGITWQFEKAERSGARPTAGQLAEANEDSGPDLGGGGAQWRDPLFNSRYVFMKPFKRLIGYPIS